MQHTKSYTVALNSLSATASQIEDVFQLGQTVNIRSVRMNSVVYPYAAPQIHYNDEKCFACGADGRQPFPTRPSTSLQTAATYRFQSLRGSSWGHCRGPALYGIMEQSTP